MNEQINYEQEVRKIYSSARKTKNTGEALPFRIVTVKQNTAPGCHEDIGKGDSYEEAWKSAYDKLVYQNKIS